MTICVPRFIAFPLRPRSFAPSLLNHDQDRCTVVDPGYISIKINIFV